MKCKVAGHSNLVKDTSTFVIHNRSDVDRQSYRAAKAAALNRIDDKAEVQELRDEIKELKSLLMQVLKNNGTELS